MRYMISLLAVSVGLSLAPSAASAKAGFLPGEAQNEAAQTTKSKADLRVERQRSIELRQKRRELRRLKRQERQNAKRS